MRIFKKFVSLITLSDEPPADGGWVITFYGYF